MDSIPRIGNADGCIDWFGLALDLSLDLVGEFCNLWIFGFDLWIVGKAMRMVGDKARLGDDEAWGGIVESGGFEYLKGDG